jgi:hypothetical protein
MSSPGEDEPEKYEMNKSCIITCPKAEMKRQNDHFSTGNNSADAPLYV